jgi:hypothetical protein
MRWAFDPSISTYDFFDGCPPSDVWGLQEAVENFIRKLERGDFLTWEAVVCHEQGLPLTAQQEEALDGLIIFGDPEDQVRYINEIPRTSEPWHAILNKIVPHLLIEPFRTFDVQQEVKCDGWPWIMTALERHGQGLSLPSGVTSFREVVPADLRHKLWLQYCFNDLSGLGQAKDMTLEDPEEHYRIDWFIDHLRECQESVAYLGLTLESLRTRLILPDKDKPIFVKMMLDKLGLRSVQDSIADSL